MTRTVIVPDVDELAAALGRAQVEHERVHHRVREPVPVPADCLHDVAERVLADLILDELRADR